MKKNILKKPVITEKTLKLAEVENQYTFEVNSSVNKIEVKNAVEEKFGVSVLKVRILNVLGKTLYFGKKRIPGKQSDTKKAIVTLKSGDKIGLFNLK